MCYAESGVAPHSRLPAVRRASVPVCSVQVGSAAAVPAVAPHSDSPSPTPQPGRKETYWSSLLLLDLPPFPYLFYPRNITQFATFQAGSIHDLDFVHKRVKSLIECFLFRIYLFLSSPNNKIRFICFPVKRKYCICFLQNNGIEKLFLRLVLQRSCRNESKLQWRSFRSSFLCWYKSAGWWVICPRLWLADWTGTKTWTRPAQPEH